MSTLRKLMMDDILSLKVAVPSKDVKGRDALEKLANKDVDGFKQAVKLWINSGSSMTDYGGVAPMMVGMFAACVAQGGDLQKKAQKISNKIMSNGQTIWDLIILGHGSQLQQRLHSDADFKNMLQTFFEDETPGDLNKIRTNLLRLIDKVTANPEEFWRLQGPLKKLTGKERKFIEMLDRNKRAVLNTKVSPVKTAIANSMSKSLNDESRDIGEANWRRNNIGSSHWEPECETDCGMEDQPIRNPDYSENPEIPPDPPYLSV